MPNCFQLIRKSDEEAGPVKLQTIDNEMREHFKQPPSEDKWLAGWYDSIGFRLALGRSLADIRADFVNYAVQGGTDQQCYEDLIKIVDWLDENFTTNAFVQVGR